ncbi:DNA-3-methyladenine glycosylase I [Demequina sp. SYSU T00192]|uniref:DNA-3-methyladenine glycosylase I n=1 Tax=Demequina litoralis TaxID=3051660 RepID=A0ABT8GA82_9MICO|nr:DNA-3-methyladenine glycosylase I [Demequina sp. SYSU T00192]MDN4476050.1 DNA-3-methyladenine glycosylase I [Demequina sp. SYSU T00192]
MITETNDLVRCFGAGDPLYERYHDEEWGLPVHGDAALLERIVLEGAQSGLAWITILRKREGYREAFAGFEPEAVAAFGEADVDRLMEDAGIVRNRRKIESAIVNARATVALRDAGTSLDALFWSFAPEPRAAAPSSWADVPASTPESVALAKELKRAGFVFVGPTTMYAAMQACGLVDDHIAGCVAARDD